MNIDIITAKDFQSLEEKINELVAGNRANEIKGLGIVYTTKELSDRLKVSTKTINNWREDRLIEFCKVRNTILFTEKAVLEFLASHSIKRKNNIISRLNAPQDVSHGKK
jgi:excisionase family DNA binding protein